MRFLTPVFNYAWKSYLKSTLHLNYKDCEIKILQFKNDTRCGGVPKPCGDDACQAFLPCLRQSASKVIYHFQDHIILLMQQEVYGLAFVFPSQPGTGQSAGHRLS